MTIQRALNVLKKKFELSPHSLSRLPKRTVIGWANEVVSQGDRYSLSQQQHAYLVGQIRSF